MVEEYLEHDMPGEFLVSLSHNLLDVTTEDIKQFVAIRALKQMSVLRRMLLQNQITRRKRILINGGLSKDSDGLDNDDEEINNSGFDSDEHNGERAEHNGRRFEIST